MFTIEYRPGYFIHGYCDRDACRWQGPDFVAHPARSMLAAKQAITRARRAVP